jgi:hypothetical protein
MGDGMKTRVMGNKEGISKCHQLFDIFFILCFRAVGKVNSREF